jgi:hypothetical protein
VTECDKQSDVLEKVADSIGVILERLRQAGEVVYPIAWRGAAQGSTALRKAGSLN